MSAFSRASIPSSVKKTIQNIKEIAGNHSDDEIYSTLKECSMDPNETAQKLLFQGWLLFRFFSSMSKCSAFYDRAGNCLLISWVWDMSFYCVNEISRLCYKIRFFLMGFGYSFIHFFWLVFISSCFPWNTWIWLLAACLQLVGCVFASSFVNLVNDLERNCWFVALVR